MHTMKQNLSNFESALRDVAGFAMIVLAFIGDAWVTSDHTRIVLSIVGTVLLLTGAQKYCPLWQVLHINTRDPRD